MKNLFFYLVFLFIGITNISFSQSITITHNLAEQTVGSPYTPPGDYSYGQAIYLQNEIQASGTITALTYYYAGDSLNNSDSVTVYIGITDKDYLDSGGNFALKHTDMSKVFRGVFPHSILPGQVTITLDSPFYYNCDSNLVIAVNETKAGGDNNFFIGYGISYANHARGLAWANIIPWDLDYFDLTPGQYPLALSGNAKITLHGLTAFSCQSPQNVRFNNILHNSAHVAWSPPLSGNAPSGYDVYYSTNHYKPIANTTPNVSTTIPADTQAALTNLLADTRYYVWVRTQSATCKSVWTVVDSFETLCAPMQPPTTAEMFDSFMPNCWDRARGLLGTPTQFGLFDSVHYTQYWRKVLYRNQTGSTNYAARALIYSDTLRHWLISPPYNLGTGGNYNLEFDMALTANNASTQGSLNTDDKFVIVVSTDEGLSWSSSNILSSWAFNSFIPATGTHITLPLINYNGIVRIGFYVQSTIINGNPNLFIDNVKISLSLPVKFLEFNGTKEGFNNLLQWRTATEQNNRGFELQEAPSSSPEGGGSPLFTTIVFVPTKAANGNSTGELSYQYTDKKPFAAGSYYRLKQVDFDGKFTYSNVVFIKREAVTELVLSALFPNPTRQLLNVVLEAPAAQRVQIIIADIAGKTLQQQTLQLVKGTNNKTVNVAQLAKGTYVVKVICADGCEAAVSKFVKE